MDLCRAKQFGDALSALFAANDIDDLRAGFFQRLACRVGDALFIGDAEDENRFAGQAEEVVHSRFASVTAKFNVTASLPSHVTFEERKNASPIRSSSAV